MSRISIEEGKHTSRRQVHEYEYLFVSLNKNNGGRSVHSNQLHEFMIRRWVTFGSGIVQSLPLPDPY